jgi:hypothetical protein
MTCGHPASPRWKTGCANTGKCRSRRKGLAGRPPRSGRAAFRMGHREVQREMRITAAVIPQRATEWAAAGPHGRIQVRPLIRAQPGSRWLARLPAVGMAAGQFPQEGLAARLTLITTAPLIPGQEAAMRWRRGRQIPPAPGVAGGLRHSMTLLAARGHPRRCPDCPNLYGITNGGR